jgi:uncharacterized phage-associated protein
MTSAFEQPEFSYNLDPAQVARYIIALDAQRPEPDVTQLKLQKLLYLAQANYLAATGRRLFAATIEAFDNGPVVYPVLKEYADYRRLVIAPDNAEWDAEAVPRDAQVFLNAVWDRYQDWTATALWKLTHAQRPWAEAHEPDAYRKAIPDEAIADYFRTEMPVGERVFHPDVMVVDQALLDELDEDEDDVVARAVEALR